MMRWGTLLALAAVLAGCSTPEQNLRSRIDRALAIAPGEGQPSKIVAAEVALEQSAREKGQWSAFAANAASGATMHLASGPVPAATWLAERRDPAQAADWEPRNVWISCDGSLAVSKGRYRAADGKVGEFVRVWQNNGRDGYSWVHHLAALDDPQPPARPALAAPEGDEIIVTAFDSIKGFVSDCLKPEDGVPVERPTIIANSSLYGDYQSRDGTLRARWEHTIDGQRRLTIRYIENGYGQTVTSIFMGAAE